MSERYQEFDQSDKVKAVISWNHIVKTCQNVKLRRSEIILGVLSIVAITVCIILAFVVSTMHKNEPSSSDTVVCNTMGCLRGAAFSLANMNSSVDPCDDFYQFACGNFPKIVPLDSKTSSKTALDLINDANIDKIKKIIADPYSEEIDKTTMQRKIKDYYQSCTDDYQKEQRKGYPILQSVIPNLGGWYVLGNWSDGSWNFQESFLKASRDFSVLGFFRFIVTVDRYQRDKRVVEIGNVGLSMEKELYTKENNKVTDALKDYMRSSARLYVRDSNITTSTSDVDSRIETFVKDAFDIEYRLAKINGDESNLHDPQLPSNRIPVRELINKIGKAIDIGSVVKHMFQGAGIDDDYKVVVHKPSVLRQAFDMIDNLGPEKKRMLNNYLVWRAMDRYNHDLSTDYLHVKRLFYAKRTGDKDFPETSLYCLQNVETHFARALGSIFIQDHFADQNKRELQKLLQMIKEEAIVNVKESSLYDNKTKERALKKIRSVKVNVGYPDFMMNSSLMNEYYSALQIDRNNYFSNVLTTNSFTMNKFASLLAKRVTDLDMWMYHTYKVNMTFDYVWNVLDVPAGLLQFPIYNKYLPHYIRYGTIGIPLAIRFVHAIDMVGGHYDDNGSMRFWFTNITNRRWEKQIRCMEKYFMSQTMGPYQPPGQNQPIMIRIHPHYSVEGMSYISGVEIAFKAYKKWQQKRQQEAPYPGINLTNEQMLLVAYAQTKCYNRKTSDSYSRVMRGFVLENAIINSVLPYTKAFDAAFRCPAKSRMTWQSDCTVFPR